MIEEKKKKILTVPQDVPDRTPEEEIKNFHKSMNQARLGVGLAPISLFEEKWREKRRKMTVEQKKIEDERTIEKKQKQKIWITGSL